MTSHNFLQVDKKKVNQLRRKNCCRKQKRNRLQMINKFFKKLLDDGLT